MRGSAHHAATVLVIAAGCPIALFAGANLACSAGGISPRCAGDGLLLSPLLLLGSGLIAAFLARGLLGFLLGAAGIAVGMLLLWIIAAIGGTLLPLDPAQALVATIWFGIPSVAGYAIGRAGIWTYGRLSARAVDASAGAAASLRIATDVGGAMGPPVERTARAAATSADPADSAGEGI